MNKDRKESSRLDFGAFCESELDSVFRPPWTDAHLEVAKIIQDAVLNRSFKTVTLPTGAYKGSFCTAACLWATLYGHHRSAVLIGAGDYSTKALIQEAQMTLRFGSLFGEDDGTNGGENHCWSASAYIPCSYRGCIFGANKIAIPVGQGSEESFAVIRGLSITEHFFETLLGYQGEERFKPTLVILDSPQHFSWSYTDPEYQHTDCGRLISDVCRQIADSDGKIGGFMTKITQGDTK